MSSYDKDYYFIRSDDDNERVPFLKPDVNTNERRFRHVAPPNSSAPFIFKNAWKEDFRKAGIKEEVADVLFEGSNFIVRDYIREELITHEISNMFIHPAVYIDDNDEWHEDYWFIGFTSRFDCWDRATSTYSSPPLTIGTKEFFTMKKYSLNVELLEKTPLEGRVLFQMGGTDDAMVVCHKSLAPIFRKNGNSGALLQLLDDY